MMSVKKLISRFIQLFRCAAFAGFLFALVGGVGGQQIRADCSNDASFWDAMNKVWVEFDAEREESLVIAAWVAKTPEQRARGFQGFCTGLVTKRSLLFSFPAPVRASFHMTDVAISLDIAFIDDSKQVVEIQRMAQQEPSQPIRYYRANAEIQFAFETMAGRLDLLRRNPGLWRIRISDRNQ